MLFNTAPKRITRNCDRVTATSKSGRSPSQKLLKCCKTQNRNGRLQRLLRLICRCASCSVGLADIGFPFRELGSTTGIPGPRLLEEDDPNSTTPKLAAGPVLCLPGHRFFCLAYFVFSLYDKFAFQIVREGETISAIPISRERSHLLTVQVCIAGYVRTCLSFYQSPTHCEVHGF